MGAYIIRRLIESLITIFLVIVVTFLISRVLGDPVVLLLPPEATDEQRITMAKDLGLDRPLIIQLGVYISQIVRGDFGQSFRFNEPVLQLVLSKFPATLYLTAVGALLAVIIALPLGIISAMRQGMIFDKVGMGFAVICQSIPHFWAAIMLILFFSVGWKIFPPSGSEGFSSVVLPAIALSLFFTAATGRLTRSNVLDELDSDYVRYARLKGVPEPVILTRHVMRNALVNIFNIVALQFGMLLGGTVIIEFIFSWPGLGRLSLDAVFGRDYPVIQASVLLTATSFVLINLMVDIIHVGTDPRVRRD